MIVINSALKQDEIITCVEAINESIHFVKKQGIALYFESKDDAALAPEVKKVLKSDQRFKVLFFNVEVK